MASACTSCTTDIAKVNGRIEVQTERVGTKFSIAFPLTLAISQALVVRCGGAEFAIPPLATVEETTRLTLRDVQKVAGEEVVNLRGKSLPLIRIENPSACASSRRPTGTPGTPR